MQAMSMIDTGTKTMDMVSPAKSSAQDSDFDSVMKAQSQPEARSEVRASHKASGNQQGSSQEATAKGSEQRTSQKLETANVTTEMDVASDDANATPEMKLQQIVVQLMKVIAAGEDSEAAKEFGDVEDLLNSLVGQLEETDLSGEQVLAGIDLTALVEQVQQIVAEGGESSVAELAEQLAIELESFAAVGGTAATALPATDGNDVTLSAEVQSKAGAMSQARDILQRVIDGVSSKQTDPGQQQIEVGDTAQENLSVVQEEEEILSTSADEKIDPRFAQLLKPRSDKAQQQSLRQQVQGKKSVQQPSAQSVMLEGQETEVAAVTEADGLARTTADLLNGHQLPKGMERLSQVVQGAAHVNLSQGQETVARVAPQSSTVQLPSGLQVTESQIFDQVVTHVSGSVNGESGRMVLRLQPAELGSLKLDLMVEGDRVKANLQAQTMQVQEVLERNLPQLRNALAEQGLKIDQFQIGLDQRSQGGQFDQMTQGDNTPEFLQSQDEQQGRELEEQSIPLAHLIQNGGGGISLHV